MSIAIPIPQRQSLVASSPTTPSLQSVLEQRKCSPSLRSCLSSSSTTNSISMNRENCNGTPSSLPSLLSLSTMESSESHPLEPVTLMEDIDQDFFNFSDRYDQEKQVELQLLKPIHSTPTLGQIESQESVKIKHSLSFVSNLTTSIRSFTNSTIQQNNDLVFSIQPRATDDRIPNTVLIQKFQAQDSVEQELETYKITAKNATALFSSPTTTTEDTSSISVIHHKEPRINSQFLRLYAYEASSRKKGLLPEITQQEENDFLLNETAMNSPNIKKMNGKEFAILVRQRLWNCVVLPPREEFPCFHNPEYVFLGDINSNSNKFSLMRKLGGFKPWVKLDDEENYSLGNMKRNILLKPRGTLHKNTQFIVKGWCNTRWIPINA